MDETKEVRQIPIEDIIPNRFQPRINFDEKALNELAESIKQHGIIQPLVLRPLGDKYEIIAGERRYKAATIAGLSTVPGIVTEMDDNASAEVALIENVQRKDLSSIEEAKSYKSMLERSNMTQEELAKKMGLSQSTIANKLRLLNLSEEVQNALTQEKISERHARALLSISDKDEQIKWLNRIINERLTVRQLDLAIKDELSENKEIDGDIPKVNINPDIESIINNAVDINSNIQPQTQNNELSENNSAVETKTNNKFFNYLEDQEVNMNMTEEPKEDISINNAPAEEFGFTPEFQNAPENNFNPDNNVEIDTLEELDVVPTNQEVNQQKIESDVPIFDVNQEESKSSEENVSEPQIDTQEELSFLQPPEINNQQQVKENSNQTQIENTITESNIDNTNNSVPNSTSSDIINAEEFIFDDDEDTIENDSNVSNDNINIDPIPIVEEEGVVDPVAYYDTLDPNFLDKVKEYVGLDLKNAINSYRDLTNKLNSQGFNITIDETDLDGKYYIEININKE